MKITIETKDETLVYDDVEAFILSLDRKDQTAMLSRGGKLGFLAMTVLVLIKAFFEEANKRW